LVHIFCNSFFFSEKGNERFFSYHETNGVVSIMLPEPELSPLLYIQGPENHYVRVYDIEFARISIDGEPLGFDEYGIVDSIAAPLSKNNISLFYVSTYDSAHVLVSVASYVNAQKALKEKFDITLK